MTRIPKARHHGGVGDAECLATVLDALVPMSILGMAGMTHTDRMAMADVDAVTGHADVLIAGGRSEPGVDPMAALVRGIAVCAYAPGGVTIFGRHWCASAHEGCPNGTRTRHWGF